MQNFSDGKVPVTDNQASSLYRLAKTELAGIYNEPELENIVTWLLEHFAEVNKSQFIQQPDVHVNQSSLIHFSNALDKLKKGIPIQYVIGMVEFYHLKLKVKSSVLIPRPETEELVDIIVQGNKKNESLKILDIGTGSGCIAISLARDLKESLITAIDISSDALKIAKENASMNGISNIEFLEINFLEENYFVDKEFDIIVSNPPYIAISEKVNMDKNVIDFEPELALFVPDNDPLIFYKAIVNMAKTHLKNKGLVYVEINEKLSEETTKIFQPDSFSSVILMTDMFGKDRFIKAERK